MVLDRSNRRLFCEEAGDRPTKTETSFVTDTSVGRQQDGRAPFLLLSVAMFLATKIHPVCNTAFDLSLHVTVNSKTEQEE